ncbi:ATP-binding protein [Pseudonocardia bannensis]|uniref:histidine kinase n=1 Tax=Pseudonocardia bannensis TaxID=630973 RepID=A0A848DP15_9PSEU|nr:ATP-binding protein [Pseudonocardia bannensis]NMH94512.1 hypothetical protein [Pseudonocardia bannensis]
MRALSPSRPATMGYAVLLLACAVFTVGWLAAGAVALVAANTPDVAATLPDAAARGDPWARGLLEAAQRSEPLGQATLDYAFSLLSLLTAAMLLASRTQEWPIRLLVIAMVASAGAFNLQAHAGAVAVQTATGLPVDGLHQVLLHAVACAAFVLALLLFPSGRLLRPGPGRRRLVVAAGVGALLLVGAGTALLPHTISCVLFFGFLVPSIVLSALLRQRNHHGLTMEQRTQARLLFSVLAAVFAVTVVLALLTWLWGQLGLAGSAVTLRLILVDPTVQGNDVTGQPTALLFWFARFASAAIAAAVLVAARQTRLWTAEQVLSLGLAATLVVALIGGGFVVVESVAVALISAGILGVATVTVLATALEALSFQPVHVRAERLVDRLLYGTRPTPYSVLARIAELSRSTPADAPDLARLAEAVARSLGAAVCRLTVFRPGLRDRSYTWAEAGTDPGTEDLVEVPVHHGEERIGSIAVDRGAVVGLYAQRRHLLNDIADSLGVVMQASRAGVELDRQLRAVLAHAGDIAVSRRQAVAEMDSERRRIERDLHDGAQHHLVSLRLSLGLVEHQVATAQFDRVRDRLDQIAGQIETAEAVLAATATGVSSPLLSERGLVAALDLELSGGHPPVALDSSGIGAGHRFPADAEAAVYFCCLEAVNNARKHAPGAPVVVRLGTASGRLCFTVCDEGPGYDQEAGPGSPGRGLRNVRARISAVGGRIAIRSRPGAGTTVEGWVPLPADGPGLAPHRFAPPPLRPRADPALLDQVRDVVSAARELFWGTAYEEQLRMLAERMDEPLRVAVVGPAGIGTSTLVAALVGGDPVSGPTRVPTWFRHAEEQRTVLHPRAGEPRLVAGPVPDGAADLDRIEIGSPSPALAAMTVIDLPGLGSALPPEVDPATALLGPDAVGAPVADASVLLLRHRRPDDVTLLATLHSGAAPPHAIGVLARADELDGRPDALEHAQRAAAECRAEPLVRRLCQVVVPVAGLLALAGATLREADYRSLRQLSAYDEGQIRRLTLSADAFTAPGPCGTDPPPPAGDGLSRHQLLEHLGLLGVRLSIELIRTGRAPTAAALAAALLASSGLPRLCELLDARFVQRSEAMKARSALLALESLLRASPQASDEARPLLYQLERIRSGAHELVEIDLVDALRSGAIDLADPERRAAELLLGASGTEPRVRLGLAPDAGTQEVVRTAAMQLDRWRRRASYPGATKDVRDAAGVLVRTCEQLLAPEGAR